MSIINELLMQLNGGLFKNKYMIELPFTGIDGKKFNCLCSTAPFPEKTLNTVSASYRGRKVYLRGDTEFGSSYTVTVYDDNQLTLRKAFDRWMVMLDPIAYDAGSSGQDYRSIITIWQLDNQGSKVYGYTLEDAFITNIGEVSYDSSEQNSLVSFNVTFCYSNILPIAPTDASVELAGINGAPDVVMA